MSDDRLVRMAGACVILLVASMSVAVPAVAQPTCTYRFPPGGGLYDETVVAGDILCGGPGRDRVLRMEGGKFLGRWGPDHVRRMVGGRFVGGRGHDSVRHLLAGTFKGQGGSDVVLDLEGGTFFGGRAKDMVERAWAGSLDGGGGADAVTDCVDFQQIGIISAEQVTTERCTSL